MPELHHKYSPSSAARWMTCPLSAALEDYEPEDAPSKYATEGSAVHEIAAVCATNRVLAWGYLDSKVKGIEVTEEMVASINDYVTLIDDLEAANDGTRFIERQVDYGSAIGYDGAFGTLDCAIVSADGRNAVIVDRKFKWGKRVEAKQNPQLMLYALGMRAEVLDLYGEPPETYGLVIHQHLEGPASTWACSDTELLAFAEDVKVAIQRCENARAVGAVEPHVGNPSEEACRYCKARATCPALASEVLDSVSGTSVDLSQNGAAIVEGIIANRESISKYKAEQLSKYAGLTELVRLWANAVDAKLSEELNAGATVPGWKLVQGRKGNRKFMDEAEVESVFKEWGFEDFEIHSHKLKTPAQLEKLVKNDRKKYSIFQSLTVQEEGKPKAAPESDPRPAIDPPTIQFEDYTTEEL